MGLRAHSKADLCLFLPFLASICSHAEIRDFEVSIIELRELQIGEQVLDLLSFITLFVCILQTLEKSQQKFEVSDDMDIAPLAAPWISNKPVHFFPLDFGLLELPGAKARPIGGYYGCEICIERVVPLLVYIPTAGYMADEGTHRFPLFSNCAKLLQDCTFTIFSFRQRSYTLKFALTSTTKARPSSQTLILAIGQSTLDQKILVLFIQLDNETMLSIWTSPLLLPEISFHPQKKRRAVTAPWCLSVLQMILVVLVLQTVMAPFTKPQARYCWSGRDKEVAEISYIFLKVRAFLIINF